MKILYLHGLDSFLTEEKRTVLAKYGECIAPTIDYRSNDKIIELLNQQYSDSNIDVVIGSSMGGFAGYYISVLLNTPCLLFNPALPYKSVGQEIPAIHQSNLNYMQIVLGRQDDIINIKDNLDFLLNALTEEMDAQIHILNTLGHRIPVEVFEDEVNSFFQYLGKGLM